MTNGILIRDDISDKAIRSQLHIGQHTFHCLERPWLDNRRNASCIPAGAYHAAFLPQSASGRYKKVWHLQAVPGRSGILIHSGNVAAHSRGCILIGKKRGVLDGQPAVFNSRTALMELNEILQGQDFKLNIIGNQCLPQSQPSSPAPA